METKEAQELYQKIFPPKEILEKSNANIKKTKEELEKLGQPKANPQIIKEYLETKEIEELSQKIPSIRPNIVNELKSKLENLISNRNLIPVSNEIFSILKESIQEKEKIDQNKKNLENLLSNSSNLEKFDKEIKIMKECENRVKNWVESISSSPSSSSSSSSNNENSNQGSGITKISENQKKELENLVSIRNQKREEEGELEMLSTHFLTEFSHSFMDLISLSNLSKLLELLKRFSRFFLF